MDGRANVPFIILLYRYYYRAGFRRQGSWARGMQIKVPFAKTKAPTRGPQYEAPFFWVQKGGPSQEPSVGF